MKFLDYKNIVALV